MTLRRIKSSQGGLTAFIPELNSNVTAGVAHHAPEAVASRPDHAPASGPAGTHLLIQIGRALTQEEAERLRRGWAKHLPKTEASR